ncbi:hypothetical protein GC176_06595 [bacterium]|nr:hypothetical protein [bacterium]
MDPRSLLTPTFVVLFLLVGTIGILCVGIPEPTDPQPVTRNLDWDDSTAVKVALEQEIGRSLYEDFVYKAVIGVGFCMILFWPFNIAKPSVLVRLILLTFCGFAAAILTGNALAAQGALLRICILGALLIGGLAIVRLFNKVAPTDSKEPVCFRWAPRHRVLHPPDDPETLERLEHLRAVTAEAPPLPS